MKPSVPYRPSLRHVSLRGFAAGGIAAAIAAAALTACGPRDETPLAGGSATVAPQTTATAVAAAPAPAPALPAQAEPARVGSPVPLAQSPTEVPPASYQDAPPQVRPVPAAPPRAPAAQPPAVAHDRIGSVTAIEPVRERPQGSGAGAVVGGVLGGVLGNQFGHGMGRAAMTGVGVAGGAIAGNNVERNYKTAVVGYRVHVRLDNGSTRTFERKDIGDLHVGDRVRLDANGLRRA
jgi:outer membrane lipoprotein SlyB